MSNLPLHGKGFWYKDQYVLIFLPEGDTQYSVAMGEKGKEKQVFSMVKDEKVRAILLLMAYPDSTSENVFLNAQEILNRV